MKLFARMSELIKVERVRSSTKNISDMIEEWEAVFAKDVHLIMIKSFTYIVEHFGEPLILFYLPKFPH